MSTRGPSLRTLTLAATVVVTVLVVPLAGALELRLELVDARTLVQEALDLFALTPQAELLSFSVPDEPVPVRCDPLRIGQVLTNLLSNAMKYSCNEEVIDVALQAEH